MFYPISAPLPVPPRSQFSRNTHLANPKSLRVWRTGTRRQRESLQIIQWPWVKTHMTQGDHRFWFLSVNRCQSYSPWSRDWTWTHMGAAWLQFTFLTCRQEARARFSQSKRPVPTENAHEGPPKNHPRWDFESLGRFPKMTRTHEVTSSHPQRSVPLSFQDRRSSHPAEIDEKPLQSLQKISESIGLINGCEIVLGFFF